MKPVRTATIRNRRWMVMSDSKAPKGVIGFCSDDGVGVKFRRIYVPKDGDTLDDLDTIVHETLHAATELNENAVEETATAIARLLWRLGWRKED